MLPDSRPLFSITSLRTIFDRWKYLLGLATALAAVISVIVALTMPNMYSSTAVFLPTSLQSADPDRLVEGSKLEIGVRSEDLDRVVTIGESLPLAELMIRRFNLHDHYKISAPRGSDQAETGTLSEFNSNYTIVHNERDAIELTFKDRNKKLAARVANAMVTAIDSVNQQLTYENRRQVLDLYRQRSARLGANYEAARRQLLAARRRYGVYGLEQQGRYLAKELIETEKELRLAEAGGPGNATALRRALRGLTSADGGNVINLENYVLGADSVNLLNTRLGDLQGRYVGSRAAYEQAEISLRTRVSSLYLVQKAYPATRKSGPFRTLIVLGSVLVTLALCSLLIILLELYRRRGQWLIG
ncbi:MAG: hypothetical protein EOO59_06650 [Hymenobacter sp.]|nr:MAG: hypothetical protein EOO59_06650 [Hymenobacter sp.]